MPQNTTWPADFLHHRLTFASRPATNSDRLVRHVLERALAVTGSDVGGGRFGFELFDQEPRLVTAALSGALADTAAHLMRQWQENPRSAAWLVLQSGELYSSDGHHHDPVHFPLLAGSRSSL